MSLHVALRTSACINYRWKTLDWFILRRQRDNGRHVGPGPQTTLGTVPHFISRTSMSFLPTQMMQIIYLAPPTGKIALVLEPDNWLNGQRQINSADWERREQVPGITVGRKTCGREVHCEHIDNKVQYSIFSSPHSPN